MSIYEKIAAVLIGILVVGMLVFSYHEITEPRGSDHHPGPSFEESLGQSLKIGTFDTVLSQQSSGIAEANCPAVQPVIVGVLHDIDTRLEAMGVYQPGTFEVNQQTLDLFCNTQASITLSNSQGDKLLLQKQPFTRSIPPGGEAEDIGTDVRINATVIAPGAVPPASPTTYGEELIPDRYLDQ